MTAILTYRDVVSENDSQVAILTLNRPERANAFNQEMMEAIRTEIETVAKNERCRALVLRAEGKHFSAGADLNWMKNSAQLTEAENRKDAALLSSMFESLANLPLPTIAHVKGSAFGGAVGLAACCDMTIAEKASRFCLSEAKLGLLPAVILPYLARRMRIGDLQRYALSGCVFSSDEAQYSGLIDQVLDPDHVNAHITELLNQLLLCSPIAQRKLKSLMRKLRTKGFMQCSDTVDAIAELRASQSGQSGLHSFFEKQPAPWAGSLSEPWS